LLYSMVIRQTSHCPKERIRGTRPEQEIKSAFCRKLDCGASGCTLTGNRISPGKSRLNNRWRGAFVPLFCLPAKRSAMTTPRAAVGLFWPMFRLISPWRTCRHPLDNVPPVHVDGAYVDVTINVVAINLRMLSEVSCEANCCCRCGQE
jgi:hypothetical protein